MKILAAVLACLLVGGCATQAQKQAQREEGIAQAAAGQLEQCQARLNATASFRIVSSILLAPGTDPQRVYKMSIARKATTPEKQAILQFSSDAQVCRQIQMEAATQIDANVLRALGELYSAVDGVFVEIVSDEVTLGEGNRRLAKAREAGDLRIAAAIAAHDRQLAQSHDQEIAQRQAALAAYQNWLQSQQAAESQQLAAQNVANAINRPVHTVCRSQGNQVVCVSR
jgi:hypothetical protein